MKLLFLSTLLVVVSQTISLTQDPKLIAEAFNRGIVTAANYEDVDKLKELIAKNFTIDVCGDKLGRQGFIDALLKTREIMPHSKVLNLKVDDGNIIYESEHETLKTGEIITSTYVLGLQGSDYVLLESKHSGCVESNSAEHNSEN